MSGLFQLREFREDTVAVPLKDSEVDFAVGFSLRLFALLICADMFV